MVEKSLAGYSKQLIDLYASFGFFCAQIFLALIYSNPLWVSDKRVVIPRQQVHQLRMNK